MAKLIGLAGQPRNQAVVNAPSSSEFDTFGVRTLSTDERDALVAVLQTKGAADFDTLGELQTLATSVRSAYARVIAFADTNGGSAPTLADYQALAITGMSDNDGHREAVNAALATVAVSGSTVAKLNALQAVADTYRLLLQQADGTADNTNTANLAKLDDFERIGVDMSSLRALDSNAPGATGNAVQLLSSIIDSRRASAVDTPQEIQQLVTLVQKLAQAEQGRNAEQLQAADFTLIGINVEAASLATLRQQLEQLPDNGSSLNTFSQLRTLVLSVTGVPAWNVVAGDDVINLAERTAGVTLSGSAGPNDVLTLFYPDGTVMKNGITVTNAGNNRWVWSYTLTSENWARLNADGADGVEKILQLQARNTSTGVDSIKVEHKVVIDTVAPPANLLIKLEKDNGSSDTDGVTNQGKVNVSNLAPGAQWEYQIDNGLFQTGSGNSFEVTQPGAHTLTVRQYDSAGNRSAAQTLSMTLDTTAPAAPVIALANAGGTVNGLSVTNNDTIRISGLEANATWQWRVNRNDFTDNPDWTIGSGTSFNPAGLSPNQNRNVYVEVRQLDQAGNRTDSAPLSFTLDTAKPNAPTARLRTDSGSNGIDGISNDGTIRLEGLEPGATWEYSLDNGSNWSTQGISSDNTLNFTDNGTRRSLLVRQIDRAGNVSDPSGKLEFTVDTTPPHTPLLALANNSSGDEVLRITNNGNINVRDLDADSTWQYSTDGGATWSNGSGNSFTVSGDGDKQLRVRQTDAAGNTTTSAVLTMKLDTTPPTKPGQAALANDNGASRTDLRTNDGRLLPPPASEADLRFEYSVNNGAWTSFSEPVKGFKDGDSDGDKNVRVRSRDRAGNVSEASDVFRFTLDTQAPAKPAPAGLGTDTGDLRTDGITNNGQLVPSAPPGELDVSYEYSVDNGAWTDLIIPIKGEKDGGIDGVKNVRLRTKDVAGNVSEASDVFTFTLDTKAPAKPSLTLLKPAGNNGTTNDGTVRIGNLEAGARWEYSLDNGANLKLQMVTHLPPQLDLDAFTDGVQASRSITVTNAEVATPTGVALMPQLAPPKANDIRMIELVSDNAGAHNTDALILDRVVGINNNLAKVDGRVVGGVSGVSYQITTVANKSTVTLSKTDGGAFTADELSRVLQSLRLQNGSFDNGVKTRNIDIRLIDGSGHRSVDLNRVTLQTDGTGLQVDLDAVRSGVQTSQTKYTGALTQLAGAGVSFVDNIVAPSSSGVRDILVKFNGIDSSTDRVQFSTDGRQDPDRVSAVFRGSIGGVGGLLWFPSTVSPEFTVIRKQNGNLTGAEIKAIVEGIKLISSSEANVERSMDIALLDANARGITSRATLAVDTLRPVLNMEANSPLIQPRISQSYSSTDATGGVKLISGEMAAPVAKDIALVRLTLPSGNEAGNDNLILGNARFAVRNDFDFRGTVGGVTDVELHYVAADRKATLSRISGTPLDGLQVKAILEAIKYSFGSATGARNIVVEVVDQANNVGRGEVVLSVDNTVPAQLSTALVAGSQKAFGLVKMKDIFGDVGIPGTHAHNLSKDEEVATPLPTGFTSAASFLAALRGISAEWGGATLVGSADRSDPNQKSYNLFNQSLAPRQELAVMQQGADSSVLGTWLNFTLKRQTGKAADDLFINHRGSFFVGDQKDLYQATPSPDKSRTGIDLANIGLLYQIDTNRPNKTPTIQVGYDGSRAAVGDVVALFEGSTMLARKVLTSDDVGSGNKTVSLTVAQSLAPGEHDIVTRYTDTAGNIVNGAAQHVSVPAGSDVVTLSNLAVRQGEQGPASAQALNTSETGYAMVSEVLTSQASGHAASGPIFSGRVGGGSATDRYLVTIEMGGKVVAFDEVAAGDFSISIPAGALPAGLYRDVNITASLSSGSALGQSTTVQGLKLGWYWAQQSAGDIVGGAGNDDILLGAMRFSTATLVQTGAGDDRIIVGSFGRSANLAATVTDFTLGADKVQVFNQNLTAANLSSFVTASAGVNPNDTRLIIDLDGAGSGTLTYTLMLQNVVYNSINTATIFGV